MTEHAEESTPPDAEEALLDDWCAVAEGPRSRRGLAMRHPALLLLVLAGASFMIWQSWPRAAYLLEAGQPVDVGVIHERPSLREDAPGDLPVFRHGSYAHVRGTVQTHSPLTDAKENPTRYFVKLVGDAFFVVLDAKREDFRTFRLRKGNSLGFPIDETGRLFDPDRLDSYRRAAQTLRLKHSIPESTQIWILDTTDQPMKHWPAALVVALMGLTAALSIFGLLRFWRRRRALR